MSVDKGGLWPSAREIVVPTVDEHGAGLRFKVNEGLWGWRGHFVGDLHHLAVLALAGTKLLLHNFWFLFPRCGRGLLFSLIASQSSSGLDLFGGRTF